MRVFWVHVLVIALLALLSVITLEERIIATFLGATISALTNFWFMWVVFRSKTESSAQKTLVAFYLGIVGKWVLTALLFLLAFKHVAFLASANNAVLMIAAYVLLQMLQTVLSMSTRLH